VARGLLCGWGMAGRATRKGELRSLALLRTFVVPEVMVGVLERGEGAFGGVGQRCASAPEALRVGKETGEPQPALGRS